eukprot:3299921-Pyramimonas_sp.AAC.1
MRKPPLVLSVKLPVGPPNAALGGGKQANTATRVSVQLPMGPGSAALGGGNACEHSLWGLRWSSRWGHETLYWAGDTHANTATG